VSHDGRVPAILEFLVHHGYVIVFVWVLLAQAGAPVPVIPLLIAAGALAADGRLDLAEILALSVVASLLSDWLWYRLGQQHGGKVLGFLCRITLEPETCVRNTENAFRRHGPFTVVFAKFVPGLSTAAPPLAGMMRMPVGVFLLLDALGAAVWTGVFVAAGWLLRDRIEALAESAAATGTWLLIVFVAVVALFVVAKFVRRQLFLRRLRIDRIAPADLQLLLAAAVPPFVVDLRTDVHFAEDPRTVPGALRLTTEEIEHRHVEIPRDRDVVLYCT
jgi:membrane protein DedA with SNARE-associated domain